MGKRGERVRGVGGKEIGSAVGAATGRAICPPPHPIPIPTQNPPYRKEPSPNSL